MTRTLIIHPGYGKCGTTAIQDFFVEQNAFLLNEHGIYYPNAGQELENSAHHALAKGALAINESPKAFESIIDKLATEIDGLSFDKLILSSEILPFILDNNYFNEFVSSFDFRIKLIFTVRRQSSYLLSLCGQILCDELSHFDTSPFTMFISNFNKLNYKEVIGQWLSHNEVIDYTVLPYNKNILENFLRSVIGDDFNINIDPCLHSKNVSFPRKKLYLLKVIKEMLLSDGELNSYDFSVIKNLLRSFNEDYLDGNIVWFSVTNQKLVDSFFEKSNNALFKSRRDYDLFISELYSDTVVATRFSNSGIEFFLKELESQQVSSRTIRLINDILKI